MVIHSSCIFLSTYCTVFVRFGARAHKSLCFSKSLVKTLVKVSINQEVIQVEFTENLDDWGVISLGDAFLKSMPESFPSLKSS